MDKLPTLSLKEFLSYFLPGIIILLAIGIHYRVYVLGEEDSKVIKSALETLELKEPQMIYAILIFSFSILMGFIVAALQSFIETFILDYLISPFVVRASEFINQKFKKSKAHSIFFDDWVNYVNNLNETDKGSRNRYISKVNEYYQFESRLGISIFFLYLFAVNHSSILWLSIGLYFMSIVHLCELGNIRRLASSKKQVPANDASTRAV